MLPQRLRVIQRMTFNIRSYLTGEEKRAEGGIGCKDHGFAAPVPEGEQIPAVLISGETRGRFK